VAAKFLIPKWPLLRFVLMGGVLRGIASSTYAKYASSQIPCAALPINKSDAFINQKHQILNFMKIFTNLKTISKDGIFSSE